MGFGDQMRSNYDLHHPSKLQLMSGLNEPRSGIGWWLLRSPAGSPSLPNLLSLSCWGDWGQRPCKIAGKPPNFCSADGPEPKSLEFEVNRPANMFYWPNWADSTWTNWSCFVFFHRNGLDPIQNPGQRPELTHDPVRIWRSNPGQRVWVGSVDLGWI